MVEGTRLEIERGGNSSVGSNPTLSAFFEPLKFNYLRRKEGTSGVK